MGRGFAPHSYWLRPRRDQVLLVEGYTKTTKRPVRLRLFEYAILPYPETCSGVDRPEAESLVTPTLYKFSRCGYESATLAANSQLNRRLRTATGRPADS